MADIHTPAYFERLNIQGYRGFQERQTVELAQPTGEPGSGLTIVVGSNNSGKSALWEGFDANKRASLQDVSFSEGRRNVNSGRVHVELIRADGPAASVRSRSNQSSAVEFRSNVAVEDYDSDPPRFPLVAVPARRQFRPYFSRYQADSPDWSQNTEAYSRTEIRDGFTGRLVALEHDQTGERTKFDEQLNLVLGE